MINEACMSVLKLSLTIWRYVWTVLHGGWFWRAKLYARLLCRSGIRRVPRKVKRRRSVSVDPVSRFYSLFRRRSFIWRRRSSIARSGGEERIRSIWKQTRWHKLRATERQGGEIGKKERERRGKERKYGDRISLSGGVWWWSESWEREGHLALDYTRTDKSDWAISHFASGACPKK